MNLVIGSCFRNCAGRQIDRYVQQVAALQSRANLRGDKLHVISVWGDSTDCTPAELGQYLGELELPEFQLIERSHGLPAMGSVTHPDRIRTFAWVANGVFENVGAEADVVIYVESDLIWEADMLYRLIDQLGNGVDVIAPLCYADGDTVYDTFGFRTPDDRWFSPHRPYWDGLDLNGITEVGSVGSCVVMRGWLARSFRCTPEEAIVGFCKDARQAGYHIYVDAREAIRHP